MQKVRYHFWKALTDCLHQILGSFNSKKVLFHLSLTVLVHYRLLKIIRLEGRSPFFNKFNIIHCY